MSDRRRTIPLLAAGSAASGILAYVFFAGVTRALGAEPAAPVSVLWTLWSFAGAALTFPVQHWIARAVQVTGGEAQVRSTASRLAAGVLVLTAAVAAVAGLARGQLFGDASAWFVLETCCLVPGSVGIGALRGVLSARRRFAAVGASLVAENAVRCIGAFGLAAAGVEAPEAYGAALVAGYVAAAAWPSAYRLGRTGALDPDESVTAVFAGAAGGQVVSQTVLVGAPLALTLAGGAPAEVTGLFAALALYRAPYTFSLGLISAATGRISRRVAAGDRGWLLRLWVGLLAGTAVAAAVAALLGALAGPWAVRLVFGGDVTLPAGESALVAAGSAVALGNLVATVLVFAQGRAGLLTSTWLLAALPGAGWWLGSGAAPLGRAVGCFVVVEAAAFVLLMAWPGRVAPQRRTATTKIEEPNGRSR